MVDLHIHSTASDGSLTPAELVFEGKKLGLEAMALTDHDTVGGIETFLLTAESENLTAIPAVEIGVDFLPDSLHILGYYINHWNEQLVKGLEEIRKSRKERAPRMIDNLRSYGFDITLSEILAETSDDSTVGRFHFARAMVRKGFVKDPKEAFDKYLSAGTPGYYPRKKILPCEAIELILTAGGLPVIAHPKFVDTDTPAKFEKLLRDLIECGLKGVEAYYPKHTKEEEKRYIFLASKYNLLVTGGSDYHGPDYRNYKLGFGTELEPIPQAILDGIEQWKKASLEKNQHQHEL